MMPLLRCCSVLTFLAGFTQTSSLHTPATRRQAISGLIVSSSGCCSLAAFAVNEDLESLQKAADDACQSLSDALSQSDYTALMGLTKEYDMQLRKAYMGKIKKTYTPSNTDVQPSALTNAVTFDLIGINKSSRPGSENPEAVAQYIAELQSDVAKFLALYQEN